MIITIHSQATSDERAQLMTLLCRITGSQTPVTTTILGEREIIALDIKALDNDARAALQTQQAVAEITHIQTAYKLVSRAFQAESSSIVIGSTHDGQPVTIGGEANSPVIMAGPCAVEDREQLVETARAVKAAGADVLRGGAFKPRTSPYQFQGLGIEGLHLLAEARELTGLPVITEVMETEMVDTIAQYADVLQIGARNMQNFALLRAVGHHPHKLPVLLKRGLSATIDEWLLAAEYIVAAGNPNVILCERGIRSYDPQTRNVLDLSCVPLLHQLTHLPIIVDPSHATGKRELVPTMSRASIAAEADGLIIEVHPDPDHALCDGRQSITPSQLAGIVRESRAITSLLHGEVYVA
ncbi:MAG TPA: 3-deoxy-7-phosphoheptulonate synthase [Ktedonobacteraceae bacterium]|nr:3-deoxy-7-phosphoheptulonate synthase [Ktedonobacteraceae bacterium]